MERSLFPIFKNLVWLTPPLAAAPFLLSLLEQNSWKEPSQSVISASSPPTFPVHPRSLSWALCQNSSVLSATAILPSPVVILSCLGFSATLIESITWLEVFPSYFTSFFISFARFFCLFPSSKMELQDSALHALWIYSLPQAICPLCGLRYTEPW